MVRLTHGVTRGIAITVQVDLNESYLGHCNTGRVVFGVQFGRWSRPSDYRNLRNPLGTEIPRVHYETLQRTR